MTQKQKQKTIYVYANWQEKVAPQLLGTLLATVARGKEIFSFEYDRTWLHSKSAANLDPALRWYEGPQYPSVNHQNFGIFLDSSPDRWGRVLMRRREEQFARQEQRPSRTLMESDYLLGVFDGHRMGAIRFKREIQGEFLDNNKEMASPPWTQLAELEQASLQLEKEGAEKNKHYMHWLKLLIAPGGSLGGARPKASVIDKSGDLWIAKFPSRNDSMDVGAWEFLVYKLAVLAKINVSEAKIKKFSGRHATFLTKRFDRYKGNRIHFASAMTLLERKDGDAADAGVSYLELVDFLIQNGSQVSHDLEELWRRIVFNISVSNIDDHLRNHGFLLANMGWKLAPAYDMNPSEMGEGLKLNISENDNSQDLTLALEVAEFFRLNQKKAKKILGEVVDAVRCWRDVAADLVPSREIHLMQHAFRIVDSK